jgi:hypothetical protein
MLLLLATAACEAPKPGTDDGDLEHSGHPHRRHHTGHTGETTPPPPFDGPATLSAAGLYADLAGEVLVEGTIATTPRYPLWSDGADKRRWVHIPPGATVDTTDPDHWVFPEGTLAFKEFTKDGVRVETRRMEKRADGWTFVSYLWREDGTDADAVPDGVPDARGTSHDVPDQQVCALCHVGPADLLLGVDAIQLDEATQALLPLTAAVPATVPGDDGTREALGYLHGNCGSCHRAGALGGERSGLLLDVAVGLVDPAEAAALVTGLGKVARHVVGGTDVVVVPGDPAASQLWHRMGLRDLEAMPPRGTEVVDDAGMNVIGAWISALP